PVHLCCSRAALPTYTSTLSLHVALPILNGPDDGGAGVVGVQGTGPGGGILVLGKQTFQFLIFFGPAVLVRVKGIRQPASTDVLRSEEHTPELQSRFDLVCRLLLENKKTH